MRNLNLGVATRRRAVALIAAALAPLADRAAHAEYGEAANMAPPALVPSPFRPTGKMADTCEVVAMGREDVCLEPKKLLTAYDQLLLGKAKEALAEPRASRLDPSIKSTLAYAVECVSLVERNGFDELGAAMRAFDEVPLEQLAGSSADMASQAKAVRASVSSVASAAKKREASPVAKAMVKLASDLNNFADGL